MSNYIPVTELHPDAEHSYNIGWRFNFPPSVEADTIMLNTERLNTLHRLGGIAASMIYDYQGDVTQFTPGITGVNGDGSAIASKAGVTTRADLLQSKRIDLNPELHSPYKKTFAVHAVNKSETASIVSDKIRSGANRETAWASVLDKAVRKSILEVGKTNLTQQGSNFSRAMDTIITVNHMNVMTKIVSDYEYATGSSPTVIASLYGLFIGLQSLENKRRTGETLLRDRRWALGFGDNQIDRYFIMKAIAAAPGLVRVRT